MIGRPHNALFLYAGDAACSTTAEAPPDDLSGSFKGHSAGSLPKGQVEATGRLRDDAASAERAS